jgi:hypothetical protein
LRQDTGRLDLPDASQLPVRESDGHEAREYSRPTDAGNTFTTGFCTTCGSTLYGKASAFPGIIGVTVGTISDPAFPAPLRSIYEQSRHHWLAVPETTAGFVKGV